MTTSRKITVTKTVINSFQEKELLEKGLSGFTLERKNQLIMILAGQEGLTVSDITDEYILNHHKQMKIDMLSDECEEAVLVGFTATNGHFYRTSRDDQINLIGQKDILTDDPDEIVPWKTENNGYILHTKEEWLKVYIEAFSHKRTQLYKYNALKQEVMKATSHEEVIAINWDEPESEPAPEEPQPEEPTLPPIEEPEEPEVPAEEIPVEKEPETPVEEPAEPIEEPEVEEPVQEPVIEEPIEEPIIEEPITTEPTEPTIPVEEEPEEEPIDPIEEPSEEPETTEPTEQPEPGTETEDGTIEEPVGEEAETPIEEEPGEENPEEPIEEPSEDEASTTDDEEVIEAQAFSAKSVLEEPIRTKRSMFQIFNKEKKNERQRTIRHFTSGPTL